jgi:hypothetical protein
MHSKRNLAHPFVRLRAAALAAGLMLSILVGAQPAGAGVNTDGFGLGIIVGEPTGIAFKGWLSSSTALDGGAAWSFADNSNFAFHMDYLVHRFDWLDVSKGQLPVYFGIGGRFKIRDDADDALGIRIPVGLNYLFEASPIDIFFEVVPILELTPETEFRLNAAIGVRFFF